jgi:hypothetical protein
MFLWMTQKGEDELRGHFEHVRAIVRTGGN